MLLKESMYEKQVEKEHYSFERYFHKFRWMSYWYQSKEIISRNDIKTCLDVGPGNDFLRKMLEMHRSDIKYQTLDFAEDLKPDFVADITDTRLENNSYDLVCAFQVLEHLKFEDFEKALCEMKRLSKKYVFISLPHNVPSFDMQLKLPGIKRFSFALKSPWGRKHIFYGQHYWEVGKRGYSARKILKIIKKHYTVIDDYVPLENQYHHFYILKIT